MITVTITFIRPSVDVPWTDREKLAPYISEINQISKSVNVLSDDGLKRVEVTTIEEDKLSQWYDIREKYSAIRDAEHQRRIAAGMIMDLVME